MKRNALLLAIAVTVTLFAVSCKKGGKTGLLVPKEAAFVFYFNTGSLSSKLSWNEIRQSEWFKEAQREAPDSFTRKVMNDPAVSGVDTDKGFCFFIAPRGRGGYGSFQGGIKDQAAFEAMLKTSPSTAGTPVKSGDLNILQIEDNAILSWNKSTFVFVIDVPLNAAMNAGNSSFSRKFPADSLILFAKNIYALKGKDLLDSDSKFKDLIDSKGDIHLWFSAGGLYNNLGMGMMDMLKLSTLTEGNISTATLSFDDGKINFNGKQYYGKELTKVFDKYSSKGVGNDLTSRLPNGDVLVAGAYSYPVGAIIDMVKMIGADGLANMFLGQKGITLEDIGKAFKGDLAFAVTDVTSRIDTVTYEGYDGKPSTYTLPKREPNYVFGMSIDDQKSFDKIYNVFSEELNKVPSKAATFKAEKGWLMISNSTPLSSGFLAGNNKPAYADKISGHALGVYFNLQKLFTVIESDMRDSTGHKMLNVSKTTWQDVIGSADYKNGTGTFQFEVNMMDKSMNSLKQLNRYADQLSAIEKERRASWETTSDTTIATEAPPKAFN